MDQPREIELKLEVDPGVAGSAVEALGLGDGETARLVATYYDTPDKTLRDHGISFRVRRSRDAYVQTIKRARPEAAGLFDRAEWERQLGEPGPDLSAVDEAGLREAVGEAGAWNAMRPAFTVDVERTAWRMPLLDGSAEVVLDQGSVLAAGLQELISEFELELRDGAPRALFGLARQLAEVVPVRLGVLTKSERGYRLLEGKSGGATKAEPLRLSPDASTAEAFASIVHACLRHFRLNEPVAMRREAAGLHQSRVALRRLRSAISIFRDVVADDWSDSIRMRLRSLAGTLGEARNLDVLLPRLDAEQVDAAVRTKLREEREAAYHRALEALASKEARLLMIDILEWSEVGAWRMEPAPGAAPLLVMPARAFASSVLDRYRRRLKKRGRGLATLDPESRHRARIEAKKLRYAAEFFRSLFERKKESRRAETFLSALEDLQEGLGALNDIATGEALARTLAARGIDLPATATGQDEPRLLHQAEKAYDRFVDAKPFWR